jgi:peptide/nickel transport system ATP-binding protein
MSGGQKQRIMIALALACRPELLIADEPTTALDVMVQAQVLDLLQDIARERGLALVIISHDLSVLATTCDRVVVMYAGRTVELGPGDQLFTHADHPYTRALTGAFPTIGDQQSRFAPAGLPGDPPIPGELPSGCPFRTRCPEAEDACAEEEPTLRHTADDHLVACIHAGKVAAT